MAEFVNKQMAQSVGNVIRSLYQMVVLVEESTTFCHVIDCDDEVRNLLPVERIALDDLLESFHRNLHPAHREDFRILTDPDFLHERLSREVYLSIDCRLRYSDSDYYWSRVTVCNATEMDSPRGQEYLVLLQNINKEKQNEIDKNSFYIKQLLSLQNDYARLFDENMRDEQTGCYNRKGLGYYESIMLKKARQDGKELFVCVLDLNGLKYLNDTFGHAAGDEALRAVSDALKKSVPKDSCVVRTGGDEFLIFGALDKDSTEPSQMEILIEKHLKEYNESHDNPYTVGASYGWVQEEISNDTESIERFIEIADKKMYEMKEKRDTHRR